MASLPRFPPPVEHRILKAACGLSPRVQRRLFGPPPQLDGQTLAPDIHALISIAARARSDSLAEGTDPAAARAQRREEAAVVGERPTIPMSRVEQVEIPGPAGPLAARLYVPQAAPEEPLPLLVYFHGGGWVIGDLETHDSPCRFLAAHSGVAVLAVDYRLAPEHPFPAAAEDAFAAYAWACAEADALGADPARVAVGGDSAGGNLAAVACLTARDQGAPPPAMQLLIYPVTETARELPSRQTFREGFLLTRRDMAYYEDRYLPPGTDRSDPRVAVLQADDLSRLPPAYVATAGFDPLRDEGDAYAQRLREAGVRVALHRHPGLVHTFINLTALCPTARAAMLEACGALRMGLAVPASS
ncbi:MAG TPA: alpha/beta hydrolase [Solirubrobacterales bacterium]|nr:alpha/beta hydrolase [Solirubrobacterales bacterium]